eukprot:5786409-Amphidinium_carterae.3
MSWIKEVWNTGQVEDAGPQDPNTIRFLGLNLDYISKKQSSSDQTEGGVTINQLEYVVETLEKFEGQFQLRTRTSAGDSDSFGKTPELPAQANEEHEHAVKQGLNLAGVAGSLNWLALRSRPDIAWAVSRASRLVTKQPSVAVHRFKHTVCCIPSIQAHWTILEMVDGSGSQIQSFERKRQTQALGLR